MPETKNPCCCAPVGVPFGTRRMSKGSDRLPHQRFPLCQTSTRLSNLLLYCCNTDSYRVIGLLLSADYFQQIFLAWENYKIANPLTKRASIKIANARNTIFHQ